MFAKRVFDLFFASLGLILLSPFLLFIVIWIRLDSPGPIFFRQTRIGRYGKPFTILKFRTMIKNADFMGSYYTINDDPRITGSGKFLRKYKLDELPQLINVIFGQMSLVGPRPQVQQHVDEYPPNIKNIVLSVPPGITGFASLIYINEHEILKSADNAERIIKESIIPDKLRHYVDYVSKRSLWLDFKLIIMTIGAVLHIDSESGGKTKFNHLDHQKVLSDKSESEV